jgi:hypothetical protein
MKKKLYATFLLLMFCVLTAKILGWFIHFDNHIDRIINTAMFSLIGLAYIVMAFNWDNKILKSAILCCGAALIILNFFETTTILNILGIISVVTPMIIARLYKLDNKTSVQ